MTKLDQVDKKILNILYNDCRTPYREIAKSLGMSVTAIKSRVDDLVVSGVIIDFQVEFSQAMIGSELLMIWLETDGTEDPEQFISEIAANRGVLQITLIYGGDYMVFAEYTSSFEFAALAQFFRSNPHITSTEMHTILRKQGKKTNLTKLQLRVLKALLKNPRKLISDISNDTGLTVRLVRKTLRELKESEAIYFTLRWRLNVGDRVTFLLSIKWDPKLVSRDEIIDMLQKTYHDEFWEIFPSASDPFLMTAMTVDNLNNVDRISSEIRSRPAILYCEAFLFRPGLRYKGLRRLLLEEAVQAAEV